MTVALSFPILITNSSPVGTIAGKQESLSASRSTESPPVEPVREPKPVPGAAGGNHIVNSLPPDPSVVLLTDIE